MINRIKKDKNLSPKAFIVSASELLSPKAFICITLLYLFIMQGAQAQNIDSLYTVFSESRGQTRINAANEITRYVYENELLAELITLKATYEEAKINAAVYESMGIYYAYQLANYDKGIDFFKLAVENFEILGEERIVDILNGYISSYYARMGKYDSALEYIMKCYEWEKSMNDSIGLSSTLNDLGVLYSQWQKPEMAIRYFEEAIAIERPLNRPMYYAIRLAALAKEYSLVDPAKALPLIKEALLFDEMIDLESLKEDRIAIHTLYLGDVYYLLDSLENAANCYKKSLAIFERKGRKSNEATTLYSLGRLQAKEKRYSEAISLLQRCEKIAEENHYFLVQRDACLLLSDVYNILEPNALSYVHLKKYVALNDSIFKETTQQQINDFQVRYETAEKQLEIERQQSEIKQHRTRQFIYIGVIISAALLLALLAYTVMLRTRRNRTLTEINAIKDKFFSIISHDLKNPAIAQRDSLQLLAENADKLDANTVSAYYRQLLKSADGLVDLLKNLLNWAQIQTGRNIYRPSSFDLVSALQSDIGVTKSMAARKEVAFETTIPQAAILTGDENMIVTVVRNLLANAVKFTAKGGQVTLDISPTGRDAMHCVSTTYIVSVADTGAGMTPEQIQNLFRIDRKQSCEGTAGEKGTGLGLIVCKEFLEKHGSTLHVESEAGKGSRFWFELSESSII